MKPSPISIVIPVRNDHNLLPFLLQKVLEQTTKPFEVLIIDSSTLPCRLDNDLLKSYVSAGINLLFFHSKPLNPGAARNIGVERSNCQLIAFLDVKTLPPSNWLGDASELLKQSKAKGVFGKTVYDANTRFEKCIRAATYGVKPIVTIPGSLLKREAFSVAGSFLAHVVAGEDTDWMLRARLHGLMLNTSSANNLKYTGLIGLKFHKLIKKWWINYRACRDIPYLADHRTIYLLLLNLLVIFISMHWNAVLANWNETSPFYISHVTKLGAGIMFCAYVSYRAFYLPIRRGESISDLFPLDWITVLYIGLIIDFVKLAAFFPSMNMFRQRARFALFRE